MTNYHDHFLFSNLEELADRSKYKELIEEIRKLENKKKFDPSEQLVYDYHKVRAVRVLKGVKVALKGINQIVLKSKEKPT